MPRTLSLSDLFDHQQNLTQNQSVLSVKGKRVLAVVLASALLPFLETPWLQLSFTSSMIHFVGSEEVGKLPDITKPFLALKHIPINSPHSEDTENNSDISECPWHRDSSVLALGILLYELHYCTSVEPMKDKSLAQRYYSCIDKVENLKDDVGDEYYLATKACLGGNEYYPYVQEEQEFQFEDSSVQRLFYQNVVKRLESVLFTGWKIRPEDLDSFDSEENEGCWGTVGADFARRQTCRTDASSQYMAVQPNPHWSMSDTPVNYASSQNVTLRVMAQPSPGSTAHDHLVGPFFDASHQKHE